jgi:hypothetical protein
VHPNASPDRLDSPLSFFLVIHVPDYCKDSKYLNFSEKSENSYFLPFGMLNPRGMPDPVRGTKYHKPFFSLGQNSHQQWQCLIVTVAENAA